MLLSSGRCNADRLASFYGVNRRTLHRRLESAGQSFTALVSDVRREIAGRRVAEGRMSLGEIAHALGFDQQSSFCRWFRQEFGASASEWGTMRRRRNSDEARP
jgi:AraC-like DNA-binding protein